MLITMFSNYLTHHQIPFCDAMNEQENVEFYFVSTMPMDSERITGGWKLNTDYPYEIKAFYSAETMKYSETLAINSDVIIIGSAPEKYVQMRMKYGKHKLTLRYSERLYKGGYWRALSPRGALIRIHTYFRYIHKPLYMLCASNYTAGDLALLGSYWNRCFKWGYFPETKRYDMELLIKKKQHHSIVWTGRFIDWKHPELAVLVATMLKEQKIDFRLTMIGDGPLRENIQKMIIENGLEEFVVLTGAVPQNQVRDYMQDSEIFLFTSDRHEGWGAVLNEAMNSGCAVIANKAIGSVGFLIDEGVNGLSYNGRLSDLYNKVVFLIQNDEYAAQLGREAYHTITEGWTAKIAAERIVYVCKQMDFGNRFFFEKGICSKAKRIFHH